MPFGHAPNDDPLDELLDRYAPNQSRRGAQPLRTMASI